jgi:predicted MPP superfamily phosphohydrolase
LKGFAVMSAGTVGSAGYAAAEPFLLNVTHYRLTPRGWPEGFKLRVALLADIHACEPWMPADRVHHIVASTNALAPDATLLLGDYVVGSKMERFGRKVSHKEWGGALAGLKAPLGVHAVLGNHDWWEDAKVQRLRSGPIKARRTLEAAGIAVYENDAMRLEKDGQPFWLAGLGDQWAYYPHDRRLGLHARNHSYVGVDNLPKTLAQITDDAPVVLMVHEPDIFPEVPERIALTVAGHTHGGQVRLAGYAPIVPSKYGQRYVYGHVVEDGRNLIVSGGLGCSGIPVRFGSPPEIVLVEIGGGAAAA